MVKVFKSLKEVPEYIKFAYKQDLYCFRPPDVYTGNWTDLSWINYVTFDKFACKEAFKEYLRR